MRIYFPRKKVGQEGPTMGGALRDIKWVDIEGVQRLSLKVSVPDYSMIQNFYFLLDEGEVDDITLEGLRKPILPQKSRCKNCGKPMEPIGSGSSLVCDWCGGGVMFPEEEK